MSNPSQLSFFDEEPQEQTPVKTESSKKSTKSKAELPKHDTGLSSGAQFMVSKIANSLGLTGEGVSKKTSTRLPASPRDSEMFESESPFVSGEYDEPFEVLEPVHPAGKLKKAQPIKKEKEVVPEGLEEPLPFKPKRDYSKYVVYTPLNQDILVYQWAVKVLPNARMLQWFQENQNRVGNPLRWDTAFDLLRKMAYREAPWELLDKIEEETGLNKRDLADALAYSDALAIIRGSDNQDNEASFMSAFSS